ncbi:MAG: hypothetical protein WCL07_04800 [bacterium]
MNQSLDEPISVMFSSVGATRESPASVRPISLIWSGSTYPILKVGLHHRTYKGETLAHVFSVVGNNIFFRIELNTDTLLWRLQEVSDGEP